MTYFFCEARRDFFVVEGFHSKLKVKNLNSQSREIIWRVSDFYERESECTGLSFTAKTAVACGVSEWTVRKIREERKDMSNVEGMPSFSTPKKHKQRENPVTVTVMISTNLLSDEPFMIFIKMRIVYQLFLLKEKF